MKDKWPDTVDEWFAEDYKWCMYYTTNNYKESYDYLKDEESKMSGFPIHKLLVMFNCAIHLNLEKEVDRIYIKLKSHSWYVILTNYQKVNITSKYINYKLVADHPDTKSIRAELFYLRDSIDTSKVKMRGQSKFIQVASTYNYLLGSTIIVLQRFLLYCRGRATEEDENFLQELLKLKVEKTT